MSSKCNQHLRKIVHFCPQCMQFMCGECECSHCKLIPIKLIQKYSYILNTMQLLPTQEQINAAKIKLTNLYNTEESMLKSAFTVAINLMDTFISKPSELDKLKESLIDAGINDKGFAFITTFAKAKKADDISSISGSRSYLQYIEKAAETIKQLSSVTNQCSRLLDFSKAAISLAGTTIHYWSNNLLTIIDTQTQNKKAVILKESINQFADTVGYNDRIFIVGGSGPVADMNEVNIQGATLVSKCPMLYKKYYHSLCTNDAFIYSIGGYDIRAIADCERYNVAKNKWINLPNLNVPRYNCTSFIMNKLILYAFGGRSDKNILSLIERINLSKMDEWQSILITNAPNGRSSLSSVQIKGDEAIIFGGFAYEHLVDECYTLKFSGESVTCVKDANMLTPYLFSHSSPPSVDANFVYAISSDRKMHKYAIGTKTWSIIG